MKKQANQSKKSLQIITMGGVFGALAVALAWLIHFPIFPAVPFLEYDAADIPIYFMTMLTGPVASLLMTAATCLVQGLTVSASGGWIGILMHLLATGSFVLSQSLILRHAKRSLARMIVAISVGTVASTTAMFLWNLLFTPLYMGVSRSVVLGLMPWILLFNLLKAGGNGTIALLLYLAGKKAFGRAFPLQESDPKSQDL